MSSIRVFALTVLAMLAFAGNSLLCRLALKSDSIDPASFTAIRLVSGAVTLWVIVCLKNGSAGASREGDWWSALALFIYAAGFSFAYIGLSAATGALLLFGAVQATMIAYGVACGERIGGWRLIGLMLALVGLFVLLLPGLSAPPIQGAMLMLAAGVAWGVYSLRGKKVTNPVKSTAGNFLRAGAMSIVMALVFLDARHFQSSGIVYAACSGIVTSALGYVIWYTVLPSMRASTAAVVQLSVPAIAALGGVLLLHESINLRIAMATVAILGGISLVLLGNKKPNHLN